MRVVRARVGRGHAHAPPYEHNTALFRGRRRRNNAPASRRVAACISALSSASVQRDGQAICCTSERYNVMYRFASKPKWSKQFLCDAKLWFPAQHCWDVDALHIIKIIGLVDRDALLVLLEHAAQVSKTLQLPVVIVVVCRMFNLELQIGPQEGLGCLKLLANSEPQYVIHVGEQHPAKHNTERSPSLGQM